MNRVIFRFGNEGEERKKSGEGQFADQEFHITWLVAGVEE